MDVTYILEIRNHYIYIVHVFTYYMSLSNSSDHVLNVELSEYYRSMHENNLWSSSRFKSIDLPEHNMA